MKHFKKKINFTICGSGGSKPPAPPPPVITQYPSVLSPPQLGDLTSISSFSYAKMIDLLSDGPIEGLVNKNNEKVYDSNIFEGIFLNDTPIKETSNYKTFSVSIAFLKERLKQHFARKIIPNNYIESEILTNFTNFSSPIDIVSYHPDTSVDNFVSLMGGDLNLIPLIKKSFSGIPVSNFRPFLTVINLNSFNIPLISSLQINDVSADFPLKLYIPNISNHIYFPIGYDSLTSFNYFEMPRSFIENSITNSKGKKTFNYTVTKTPSINAFSARIFIWSLYESTEGMMDISIILDKYFNNIYAIKNNPSLYNYNLVSSEFKTGSELQTPLSNFSNVEIDTDYRKELVGPFKLINAASPTSALGYGGIERLCSFYGKFPNSNLGADKCETSDDIRYIKTWPVEYATNGDAIVLRNVSPNFSSYDSNSSSRVSQDAVPITHYIENQNVDDVYVTVSVDQLYDTNHIDLVANNSTSIPVALNKYNQTDPPPLYTKKIEDLNGVASFPGSVSFSYRYLFLKNDDIVYDVSCFINGTYNNLNNFFTNASFFNSVQSVAASSFEKLPTSLFPDGVENSATIGKNGFSLITNRETCKWDGSSLIPYGSTAASQTSSCYPAIFKLCNFIAINSSIATKSAIGQPPDLAWANLTTLLDNGSVFSNLSTNDVGTAIIAVLFSNLFQPSIPRAVYALDTQASINNLTTKIFNRKIGTSISNFYCFGLTPKQSIIKDDFMIDVSSTVDPSAKAFFDLKVPGWKIRRVTVIDQDTASLFRRAIVAHVINYAINWSKIFKNWASAYSAVPANSTETDIDYAVYPFIYKFIYQSFVSKSPLKVINGINYLWLDKNASTYSPSVLNNSIGELVLLAINGSYLRGQSDYWEGNFLKLSALEDLLSKYLISDNVASDIVSSVNSVTMDTFYVNANVVNAFEDKLKIFNFGNLLGNYSVFNLNKISINNATTFYTQSVAIADPTKLVVTDELKTSYTNNIYLEYSNYFTINNSDQFNDFVIYYNLYQKSTNTLNANRNALNTSIIQTNSQGGSTSLSATALKATQTISAGTRLPSIVRLKVETGYEQKEFCNYIGACEYFSYDYAVYGMSTEKALLDLGRNTYPYLQTVKTSNDAGGYVSTQKNIDIYNTYNYGKEMHLIKVKVVKNGVETTPLALLNDEVKQKYLNILGVNHNNYVYNCINNIQMMQCAICPGTVSDGCYLGFNHHGVFANNSGLTLESTFINSTTLRGLLRLRPFLCDKFFPYGNSFVNFSGREFDGTTFLTPDRNIEIYGLNFNCAYFNTQLNTSGSGNIMPIYADNQLVGLKVKPSGFKLFQTGKESPRIATSIAFLKRDQMLAFGANDSYLNPNMPQIIASNGTGVKWISWSGEPFVHSFFTKCFQQLLFAESSLAYMTGFRSPTSTDYDFLIGGKFYGQQVPLSGYSTDSVRGLIQWQLPKPSICNNVSTYFNEDFSRISIANALPYLQCGQNATQNLNTAYSGIIGNVFTYSGDPYLNTGHPITRLYITGFLYNPSNINAESLFQFEPNKQNFVMGNNDFQNYRTAIGNGSIFPARLSTFPTFRYPLNNSVFCDTQFPYSSGGLFQCFDSPSRCKFYPYSTYYSGTTSVPKRRYFDPIYPTSIARSSQCTISWNSLSRFQDLFPNVPSNDIYKCALKETCTGITYFNSYVPKNSSIVGNYLSNIASPCQNFYLSHFSNDVNIIETGEYVSASQVRNSRCFLLCMSAGNRFSVLENYKRISYSGENFLCESSTSYSRINTTGLVDTYVFEEDSNNYVEFKVYSYPYDTYRTFSKITPPPGTFTSKDLYITFFFEETSVFFEMISNFAGVGAKAFNQDPVFGNLNAPQRVSYPKHGFPIINAWGADAWLTQNKFNIFRGYTAPLSIDDACSIVFAWPIESESFTSVNNNKMGYFGIKFSTKETINPTNALTCLQRFRYPYGTPLSERGLSATALGTNDAALNPASFTASTDGLYVAGTSLVDCVRYYDPPVAYANQNKKLNSLMIQCLMNFESCILEELNTQMFLNSTSEETINFPDIYLKLSNGQYKFDYLNQSTYQDFKTVSIKYWTIWIHVWTFF